MYVLPSTEANSKYYAFRDKQICIMCHKLCDHMVSISELDRIALLIADSLLANSNKGSIKSFRTENVVN